MTVTVGGRGPELLGTLGLFLALSTITIILRCYCRIVLVKSFGLDDWSAVIAWVLFVIYSSFAISGVHYGTGQHAADIPPGELVIALKWWWACEPAYILTCMALKFSIGIFLLRIAVAKTHRIIIWTVIVVTEVYSAFFCMLFLLQCRPSAYFWTQYTGGKGSCINPKVTVDAFYGYSAISCLADWILGIIPVFLVWNLQMNKRTKLSVAAILAVGAIASSATIIRIPYISGMADLDDFLYSTMDVAIWSTVEPGIGITASAVATLRPLFRAYFSSSFATSDGTNPSAFNRLPKSDGPSKGYIHSKGIEFTMRSNGGKSEAVTTTVIEGDADVERGDSKRSRGGDPGWWNDSQSKLREEGSDLEEENWKTGIVKTTGMTQVID